MYPGRFEYFSPGTLDEALSTLDRLGERARAGGIYLKLERRIGDLATVGVAVPVAP